MNQFAVTALFSLLAMEMPLEPIPDRLVVLTFDDSSKSHFTVVRPILKKHGFGATFFITEGWDFAKNKTDYMTWEEITQLSEDGFEIGNHTADHGAVTGQSAKDLARVLGVINDRCEAHGIPKPVTFAYPGNAFSIERLATLRELGIQFARRGGSPEYPYEVGRGIAYEPGFDDPLLVPTAGDARPTWTLENLKSAVATARNGKIAVLQFHGVPDTAHDWVSTPPKEFESYMQYLADEKFTVISLRDLGRYVDYRISPSDPLGVIEDRKKLIANNQDGTNARPAKDDEELHYWLENALVQHRFTAAETGTVLGLTADEVKTVAERLRVDVTRPPLGKAQADLKVLPYPGGRHPRIGFRDGAIRPQRESKVSVFAPWQDGGYAVVDVPEAVWFEASKKKPELLYLAHTHIPTFWDKQSIRLAPLEWTREPVGRLSIERVLPNNVTLTSKIQPSKTGVRMEFQVTNGSDQLLTGLRIQMCVMLANLKGFEPRTNDNKVFSPPFAACRNTMGDKWIIVGWERCGQAWGNPPCPCLHSDPILEDVPPGESKYVRGWISFFEGKNIETELNRLTRDAFP